MTTLFVFCLLFSSIAAVTVHFDDGNYYLVKADARVGEHKYVAIKRFNTTPKKILKAAGISTAIAVSSGLIAVVSLLSGLVPLMVIAGLTAIGTTAASGGLFALAAGYGIVVGIQTWVGSLVLDEKHALPWYLTNVQDSNHTNAFLLDNIWKPKFSKKNLGVSKRGNVRLDKRGYAELVAISAGRQDPNVVYLQVYPKQGPVQWLTSEKKRVTLHMVKRTPWRMVKVEEQPQLATSRKLLDFADN